MSVLTRSPLARAPAFVHGCRSLLVFRVNKLVGSIPAAVSALTALDTLLVDRNSLSGTIPESLSTIPALRYAACTASPFMGVVSAVTAVCARQGSCPLQQSPVRKHPRRVRQVLDVSRSQRGGQSAHRRPTAVHGLFCQLSVSGGRWLPVLVFLAQGPFWLETCCREVEVTNNFVTGALPSALAARFAANGYPTLLLGNNCFDQPFPAEVVAKCAAIDRDDVCVLAPQGRDGCKPM